jgi:O-antigen/teichoic acid export membrane protein
VAVNTVAIPHWSFQGAAAATLLTEVVVLIPLALLVRRIPHVQPFPAPSLGPLAMTGVLTFGLGAALAATPLPWAAAAVLTGVFFTVVARCSGALDVDDLRGRR